MACLWSTLPHCSVCSESRNPAVSVSSTSSPVSERTLQGGEGGEGRERGGETKEGMGGEGRRGEGGVGEGREGV